MRNVFFADVINMMVIIKEVQKEFDNNSEFDFEVVDYTAIFCFHDTLGNMADEIAKRFIGQKFSIHFDVVTGGV